MSFTPGGGVLVEIPWHANPFRGDKLEEVWTPAAEAVLDYGASFWSFVRSQEGGQDFRQQAVFPAKADFDRYWYSEEIDQSRIEIFPRCLFSRMIWCASATPSNGIVRHSTGRICPDSISSLAFRHS